MKTGRGIVGSLVLFCLLLVTTLGAAFYIDQNTAVVTTTTTVAPPPIAVVTPPPAPAVRATSSLWFVGDVMLSREVGVRMLTLGNEYPWQGIVKAFKGAKVMANFESCLSDTAAFEPQEPLRFPVPSDTAVALSRSGISHVSLANNHALDCGAADLLRTRQWFDVAGIEAIGHPVVFSDKSIGYTTLAGKRVALITLHTLFANPDRKTLQAVIASSSLQSDVQVVYVHWGEEYAPAASIEQRALATTLSELGVDIIIGHHPHVVQPIERIGDTLVLYSLGNLIFDQYFSEAVQIGLTTKLEVGEGFTLMLYPVTSLESRNQPQFMSASGTERFLDDLAGRSDPRLYKQIKAGIIDLFFLATSSKSAIITQ
jgi:gamma-polyglutamate biosynthesis protein CapA